MAVPTGRILELAICLTLARFSLVRAGACLNASTLFVHGYSLIRVSNLFGVPEAPELCPWHISLVPWSSPIRLTIGTNLQNKNFVPKCLWGRKFLAPVSHWNTLFFATIACALGPAYQTLLRNKSLDNLFSPLSACVVGKFWCRSPRTSYKSHWHKY